MATAESLFDTTRNFLTPESIQKISLALNEPTEIVEAGIKEVVPTLLTGLINEGSTSEGAQKIVKLVENQNWQSDLPQNLNDRNYLSRGENVVEDIFGHHYHMIASTLSPETGMKSHSVEKLMGMVAPAVMGTIGNKIKDEGLNASSLNRYFLKQRELSDHAFQRKKVPYSLIAPTIILLSLAVLWFLITSTTLPVARITRDLAGLERAVTNNPVEVVKERPTLRDLPEFMKTGSSKDLPKRFNLKNVNFAPGTTDFVLGGDNDLNLIARTLKLHPEAEVSIEAYAEGSGDADENLLLSENRAMLIREELIGRGIEPSRIKAEGRGPRVEEGQVYFVITRLK
jgi:OmpA-OmpF porin, OOP family